MTTTLWLTMKPLMTQKRASEDYKMDDKAPATNSPPANDTPLTGDKAPEDQ